MKKITILLLCFSLAFTSFANSGVNFVKNMTWTQILAKAAREKKMIFFDAFTTWCGPCKYLEENVYTDAAVAAYFNANYINVKFDMEDGEGIKLSEKFNITSYPTLIFFSSAGKLVHKVIGAMEATEFLQLGIDAKDPTKQYYTLKNKITSGQGSSGEFIHWTEMASDLEDDNRGTVASTWLAGQKDILANVELARATILYTDVTEAQLTYLYSQKKRIAELLGWDDAKTDNALYRKLLTIAITKYESNQSINNFKNFIARFDSHKVAMAMAELKMMEAFSVMDTEAAMKILTDGIKADFRLGLDELCFLFIDYSNKFNKTIIEELANSLDSHTFTDFDKGKECWIYLTKVICYSKLDNINKAKENAVKAYSYTELPENYRVVLKESYGL